MDINGINNEALQTAPTHSAAPTDQFAQNREVVQAVKALNQTELLGQDQELRYQKDPQTGRMVLKMVNSRTQEVISQIPPEYVLALAEDLKNSK